MHDSAPAPVSPPATGAARPPSWMHLALVFAAFVAAAGTLWGGWVGDDLVLVRDNAELHGGGRLTRAIARTDYPAPSEAGAYRPVTLASLALTTAASDRSAGSGSPFLDHLVNLLLHVLGAWLFFRVILTVLPFGPWPALAAALVFAVHPLHVGTVASVAGRADLLAFVFGCASLLAWCGVRPGRLATLPLAVLAWFLALASHEAALGLAALFPFVRASGAPRAPRLALAAFLPALLLYLVGGGTPSGHEVASWGAAVLDGVAAFGRTVVHLLIPQHLPTERVASVAPVTDATRVLALVVAALTVFAGLRLVLGRAGWVSRAWLAAVLLLLVPLLVFAGRPVGLSLAYVVTAPLCLCLAVLTDRLLRGEALMTAAVGGLVALGALTYLSVQESAHWRDDETRFSRRLALRTDDIEGQTAFARYLRKEAEYEKQRAALMVYDAPERGAALRRRDRLLARALEWASRATQGEGSRKADAWRERGLVMAALLRWPQALSMLVDAAKFDARLVNPENLGADAARGETLDLAEMYFAIGRAHDQLGSPEEAAEPYRWASALAPDNGMYMRQAGQALTRVGRYREGIALLERAGLMTADPEERKLIDTLLRTERQAARRMSEKHLRVARAAQEIGRHTDAVKAYERALQVDGSLIDARLQAGYLRAYLGNYRLAYKHLDEADALLRDQPDDPRRAKIKKLRVEIGTWEADDLAREAREREEDRKARDAQK